MKKKKRTSKKKASSRNDQRSYLRYSAWGAVVLILILTMIFRIHFLEVPLERDEGEYAYAGQLILQGVPPYMYVYNMKMPGIYMVYSMILSAFGQTPAGIHLGLLIANMSTILLIFLLGKKLFDEMTGVVASACYSVLSMGQYVQGVFANAEHFVILSALGGILVLLVALERNSRWSFFLSGFLLGLAFMMKQHGVFLVVFAIIYAFCKSRISRSFNPHSFTLNMLSFGTGALLPFGLTCLIFLTLGAFDKFWFWTFIYAREYASSVPISRGLKNLVEHMSPTLMASPLIFAFAGTGFIALLWRRKAFGDPLFLAWLFLFSFLSVIPGFYFRMHYFLVILPAVSLSAGMMVSFIGRLLSNINSTARHILLIMILLFLLLDSVYRDRTYLFETDPFILSRMTHGLNPFPESLAIAKYIKSHTTEKDRIAVIGSEPQIYFYANRRSATGFVYTYPLMENHSYAFTMQREMIREIESAQPKYLVFVNIQASWLFRTDSDRSIFKWFNNYERQHYDRVGVIDILSHTETQYKWDEDSYGYYPRSRYWLYVFRRKT